jgi:type II restriction enzyme
MLQAASIYTQGKGESWNVNDMFNVMLEIANTSLQVLWSDLFNQTK